MKALKVLINTLATDLWSELRFKDGYVSGFIAWMLFSLTASCAAMLILDKFFHRFPPP